MIKNAGPAMKSRHEAGVNHALIKITDNDCQRIAGNLNYAQELHDFPEISKIFHSLNGKMSQDSLIYGLEFQARALAAQVADKEKSKFLIGTLSLKSSNNQVHMVQLNEEDNSLTTKVYNHNIGEIWSLSCSTKDSNILSSCYNVVNMEMSDCCMKTSLWKLPPEEGMNLELVCHFEIPEKNPDIKITTFHPNEENWVANVVDNKIIIWDIGQGTCNVSNTITMEGKGQPKFTTGKWNPTANHQFATCNDCCLRGWDTRIPEKPVWSIENAHEQCARDLDFNPNWHWYMASCGDDGKCRFWDLRNTSNSVISREDHRHWVWAVRYNHYHDELVATCGTDTRVLISRISSICSASICEKNESEGGDNRSKLSDEVIATFDQHEDSVYGVEWSAADPWILASLSYDGRLLINKVPKEEKFKILL